MGERIGRIGRIRTDFFLIFHGFQAYESQKNPFVSARSAPSVFPSYRFFQSTFWDSVGVLVWCEKITLWLVYGFLHYRHYLNDFGSYYGFRRQKY
jgi:hypothetical protein